MEIRTEKMLSADARRGILERIMAYYNMQSQSEFARRLGISSQNVSSWFSRGTYNVELVAVCFPELSGDWLLTGEEPMLKADRKAPQMVVSDSPEMDLHRALSAIAEEQKLTAKAQAQSDKLLSIMHSLTASLRRLQTGAE